jgi:hypothetical protein
LLGVQEVPGSNPGSPTNPFNKIRGIAAHFWCAAQEKL